MPPWVNPVTVHRSVPLVWHVLLPGAEVTTYLVIGAPPSEAGAVHVTSADVPFCAVAVPMTGAPGAVAGVTGLDGDENGDGPFALFATTVNVYG